MALISGLQLGTNPDPLATQMMIDFLSGHLGSTGEQQLAANVVRVILAGNSLSPPELESDVSISDALVCRNCLLTSRKSLQTNESQSWDLFENWMHY